ncbi:hypothetical protein Pmani_027799 [Petrolisthes manimaculis]|uniref:Translation initiation factor eIF2B subunit delta n=1 Tax=Petrolisthes manimaculis TaxID=1843537 RepID=A0AAE1P3L1_9EUCA|nr:hypothetical protein Pmani_027799 [Petrolisthes manimaculis]
MERKARKQAKKAKKKGGDGNEESKQQQTGKGKTEDKEGQEESSKPKKTVKVDKTEKDVKKETNKSNKTVKVDKVKPAPTPSTSVPNKKEENKKKTPKEPVQEKQQQTQGSEVGGDEADGATGGKSKAELKRERREKQEAQRLAKMAAKTKAVEEKQPKKKVESQADKKSSTVDKKKKGSGDAGKSGKEKSGDKKSTKRRIPLLGHLTPPALQAPHAPVNSEIIHPAVRTLGIKMKDRVIDGSTARVISTLVALKKLINDYQTPESCDLSRDLAEKLAPNVEYLNACRPQAVAMDNAIRFLKHKVNSIAPNMPEGQAKDELRTAIEDYIKENITLASSAIASHAAYLMQPNDVILTFGYSGLVCEMVEAACKNGNIVNVVVADSPQPPSGLAMVQRLASLQVPTYYRLITDITNVMDKVTKVVVEAEAVMMNGAIQGLCGTTSLALAAATYHKPFIVLCHTYKFCNNDLTDSIVVNELGDADKVVWGPKGSNAGLLAGWQETRNLNVVSLVYDVTPASLVTVLVTEQSVLPTSAVPVIIRRNYADVLGQD